MVKIRNSQTGEVRDVPLEQLGQYGLTPQNTAPTATQAQPMQQPPPQQVPQQAPQQVPPNQTQAQTPTNNTNPQYITGHSIQEHEQALKAARAAGDTTAQKQINDDIQREYNYQKDTGALSKTTGSNKLSADDQKRHDALQIALASLDGAEQNLVTSGGAKGPLAGKLATVPVIGQLVDPSGAAYHNTKVELATQMAKAITGGSRPPETVINKYLSSLPDVTDTSPYAQDKLTKMRNELLVQAKSFKYDDLIKNNPNDTAALSAPQQQQPQTGNNAYDAIKTNPITNFLLGGAANVAQDIGGGIRAMGEKQSLSKNETQAQLLEQQSQYAKSPQEQKDLLAQANQLRSGISNESADIGKSFSPDVKQEPIGRALGAASQIATTGEGVANIPGILKGGGGIIKTLTNPAKAIGAYRGAAANAADQAGVQLSGNKIIDKLLSVRSQVPSTELEEFDNLLSGAKSAYQDKTIGVSDAVGLNSRLNDAFTASGKMGKSAKALVERTMGDAIKGEMKDQAPQVAKANQLFHYLYTGQKQLGKAINPFTIGVGAAGAIGGILGKKLTGN